MDRIFVNPEKCLACRSCEIACAVEHSQAKDLFLSLTERPSSRTKVEMSSQLVTFPLQCRHCEEPYCLDACISGALSKDPETGLVTLNEKRCAGCWMCVMVCPFGVIKPGRKNKIALRCDLCQGREEPACVDACPTRAIFFGTAAEFKSRLRSDKSKLKKREKVCVPNSI